MTTTAKEETRTLIRELAAAYTQHPEALEIGEQVGTTSCLWMLRGHRDDEPLLVGINGCHVRALARIVAALGVPLGQVFRFKLLTEHEPQLRPRFKPKTEIGYDPEPARLLMEKLLEATEIGPFGISVGAGEDPRDVPTFVFVVTAPTSRDRGLLQISQTGAPEDSIVGALSTLFRAIGRKHGVKFEIRIGGAK